jgi:hypothetical protein
MKAVLEFTYPDDEHALKYALKGEEYYTALNEIDTMLFSPQKDVIDRIKNILDRVLEE